MPRREIQLLHLKPRNWCLPVAERSDIHVNQIFIGFISGAQLSPLFPKGVVVRSQQRQIDFRHHLHVKLDAQVSQHRQTCGICREQRITCRRLVILDDLPIIVVNRMVSVDLALHAYFLVVTLLYISVDDNLSPEFVEEDVGIILHRLASLCINCAVV